MKDAFVNIDFALSVGEPPEFVDEEEITRWFQIFADGGVTGALWSILDAGRAKMRSKTWSPLTGDCFKNKAVGAKVDQLMETYDPPGVAVRAARAAGQKIYLWVTLFQHEVWRESCAYADPFFATHPFYYVAARHGGYWTGIPSYAHPEARAHMIDLIRECAGYNADGIVLCTRSHCKWPWGWLGGRSAAATVELPKSGSIIDDFPAGDEFGYGFDDPVVEEYERRHGVNIRAEDFDVEEWHRIKGEFFTHFLREARATVPEEQQMHLIIFPDRYSAIGQYHPSFERWPVRFYKDCETWKRERLLDGLVLHFDRDNAGDLSAADQFAHLRDDDFDVRAWMHIFPGASDRAGKSILRSTDEVSAMGRAVTDGPLDGVFWHEFANWYYRDRRTNPDSPYPAALASVDG